MSFDRDLWERYFVLLDVREDEEDIASKWSSRCTAEITIADQGCRIPDADTERNRHIPPEKEGDMCYAKVQ